MEKPARYITPKVPTSESGTATLGIKVAEALRKNKNITITTRHTASSSSNCTSRTEARIVTVRSVNTCTSSEAGRLACNCGRILRMRSTASITLAPGWRWMFRITPVVVPDQAMSRAFSTSSMICATSVKRSGLPFL